MPLEEQIAALVDAVKANTAALNAIGSKAKAATADSAAPAEDKAPAETGRRRGGRPSNEAKAAEASSDAAKSEKFKNQVIEWMNWDDQAASEEDVKKERDERKTFVIGVSGAFGVERASAIPIEHHEKVLAAMQKFADGDDVNPASLAPQRKRGA